jgi:hypothetical protein
MKKATLKTIFLRIKITWRFSYNMSIVLWLFFYQLPYKHYKNDLEMKVCNIFSTKSIGRIMLDSPSETVNSQPIVSAFRNRSRLCMCEMAQSGNSLIRHKQWAPQSCYKRELAFRLHNHDRENFRKTRRKNIRLPSCRGQDIFLCSWNLKHLHIVSIYWLIIP